MARARRFAWEELPERELLQLRLRDLGLRLEGTWLQAPIAQLYEELAARDLRLRPHVWLSEEWFSPAGVPGIAIPFFLAHPRLLRLERKHMREVEGGTRRQCLQLLRHEAGHALQHAFRLQRRRRWQSVFGPSSTPYPEVYRPNPGSRRFVLHLDDWYAQSHPDEDFAETFAVWLAPGRRWRRRYAGWAALRKLEYVDSLMGELAGETPPVRRRVQVDPLGRIATTLGDYYAAKRERYLPDAPSVFDADLLRLFRSGTKRGEPAAAFLREHRAELRRLVTQASGRHHLTLETVLDDMIERARDLRLRAVGPRRKLLLDFAILLTARSVEYVYRGRHWHAL